MSQANTLRFSILRILISTISISEQWIYEFVPEILELVVGPEEDVVLRMDSSPYLVSRVEVRKQVIEDRLNGIQQRLNCINEVYKLSKKIPLPQISLRAMFVRVVDLFLSPELSKYRLEENKYLQDEEDFAEEEEQKEDNEDLTESSQILLQLRQIEITSVQTILLFRDGVSHRSEGRKNFEMRDIARNHRREFIDTLLSEDTINKEQKKSRRISSTQIDVTNVVITNGVAVDAQQRNSRYLTVRQLFCVIMLELGATLPISHKAYSSTISSSTGVLQDITNVQRVQMNNKVDIFKQKTNDGISIYDFNEKDAKAILDVIASYSDETSSYDASDKERRIISNIIENLWNQCQIAITQATVGKDTLSIDRTGRKRKNAPDDLNEDENEQKQNSHAAITKKRLEILREVFFYEPTHTFSAHEPLQWAKPVIDLISRINSDESMQLQEKHCQAIEVLACNTRLESRHEGSNEGTTCNLCQRHFIMTELSPRNLEDSNAASSDLIQSMKQSFHKLETSTSSARVAFWRAFGTLLVHVGEQAHSLYSWLHHVSQDLRHPNRLVRLAAGYSGNVIIAELFRHNPALNPNGQLSSYFNALDDGMKHSKASVRLTTATVVADLIRYDPSLMNTIEKVAD